MNNIKWKKDITEKDELPRLVGAQHATGDEQRNSSRRNEEAGHPWRCPVVDVSGSKIKVQCCKE